MHRNRPNRQNLRWRRPRSAGPPEVSDATTVYRRSGVAATAPPLDPTAMAEFGRLGARSATGPHPDPASGRPLPSLRHRHRQLLSKAGAPALHQGRRLPTVAARLGAAGVAPLCPGPRSGAAAARLDLASRPLSLL